LSVRQVVDLHVAVREAVRHAPRDATVAVIAADDAADEFVSLIDVPDVTVVPASMVKGLEYDHVIVVEPAEIVAAEPRGLNRLYVALTRAVAGLVILHQANLPAALDRPYPARRSATLSIIAISINAVEERVDGYPAHACSRRSQPTLCIESPTVCGISGRSDSPTSVDIWPGPRGTVGVACRRHRYLPCGRDVAAPARSLASRHAGTCSRAMSFGPLGHL
jgi:UvrD-like helicase C-terminal domain